MFLSLEKPVLKGVTIFVHNLVPEVNFAAHLPNYDSDSDRYQANYAIRMANEQLGERLGMRSNAIPDLFHQANFTSSTGWEYLESYEYRESYYKLIFQHALLVSEAMKLPLNVHVDIMRRIIFVAAALDISVDFDRAKFEGTINAEFGFTKGKIDKGEYYTLKSIRLPN